MKKNKKIKAYCYKNIFFIYFYKIIIIIFSFLFELLIIYFKVQLRKKGDNNYINNSLENNFAKYMCKVFILEMNSNCLNDIFINNNFYNNLKDIKHNIRLSINNIKRVKIENIIILICLMPFIKGKSKIEYRIKNKVIYNYFKSNIKLPIKKNNIVMLTASDYHYFNDNFFELLNYKWEFIPKQYILNHLRHIIKNFYNASSLNIFDESLNLNFYYYLKNKNFLLSFENITDLISKSNILLFFLIANIGMYKIEKCIGKGSTGRVSKYYLFIKIGL